MSESPPQQQLKKQNLNLMDQRGVTTQFGCLSIASHSISKMNAEPIHRYDNSICAKSIDT